MAVWGIHKSSAESRVCCTWRGGGSAISRIRAAGCWPASNHPSPPEKEFQRCCPQVGPLYFPSCTWFTHFLKAGFGDRRHCALGPSENAPSVWVSPFLLSRFCSSTPAGVNDVAHFVNGPGLKGKALSSPSLWKTDQQRPPS